eukprot:4960411-Amphidinium_carterae.1
MLEVYNEIVHDLLQDNREVSTNAVMLERENLVLMLVFGALRQYSQVMLKTKVNVHLLPTGAARMDMPGCDALSAVGRAVAQPC